MGISSLREKKQCAGEMVQSLRARLTTKTIQEKSSKASVLRIEMFSTRQLTQQEWSKHYVCTLLCGQWGSALPSEHKTTALEPTFRKRIEWTDCKQRWRLLSPQGMGKAVRHQRVFAGQVVHTQRCTSQAVRERTLWHFKYNSGPETEQQRKNKQTKIN